MKTMRLEDVTPLSVFDIAAAQLERRGGGLEAVAGLCARARATSGAVGEAAQQVFDRLHEAAIAEVAARLPEDLRGEAVIGTADDLAQRMALGILRGVRRAGGRGRPRLAVVA